MKKAQLFELRKETIKEFNTPTALTLFIENMLGEQRNLPMVVGYEKFDPKENWKIIRLKPLTKEDSLTVEMYLSALEAMQKLTNKDLKIRGKIVYEGVETMHYSNWDSQILGVYVRDTKNPGQSFDLDFHFSARGINEERKVGYHASSKITLTELEEVAKRFVGPNTRYERLLR